MIAPSIDSFAPKNRRLEPTQVRSILAARGIVGGLAFDATFQRSDGSQAASITAPTFCAPFPDPDAPSWSGVALEIG